tara:strand:- start:11 stop:529 length:519 start_codon:yes stop_codon:yes gene_type:complete
LKKLTVVLISVIFTTLIIGSIQLISADHLEPGLGIFKNEKEINTISTEDSKYQIYVTVEIRNAQGELIGITEATRGIHIAHEITDYTFNEKLGEKEIITIDNIKYEKHQFMVSHDFPEDIVKLKTKWTFPICGEIGGHSDVCVPVFQVNTDAVYIEEDDNAKNYWTVLREMN